MKILFWLAAPLALAACSSHDEPAPLAENADNVLNEETAAPPPVTENVSTPATNASNVAAAAPAATPDESAQMRDDADATGLTARLPEEETGQPANSADVQR